jgi:hypothetical protein
MFEVLTWVSAGMDVGFDHPSGVQGALAEPVEASIHYLWVITRFNILPTSFKYARLYLVTYSNL